MSIREKQNIDDNPGEGEGRLILTIGDFKSFEVAGVRIHLDRILRSGADGGKRELRLILIGPKSVPIKRIPRP